MPTSDQYPPVGCYDLTVTVSSGQTTSPAVDLRGGTLCGVFLPAAITGTTLGFQVAPALGGTYVTMADGAGNDVSKTVAASKYVPLSPSDFAGVEFLKLVMASQAADRTITLAVRPC